MDFAGYVECGFKCERVCPVSRGVKKFYLRDFLDRYLSRHEPIAWPCMYCHACDAICHGEKSPRLLIQDAMQEFLKDHENALSSYRKEYLEHGRIGVSGISKDDLVLPDRIKGDHSFLKVFDRIVVFPGCIISSRFPKQVAKAFQLVVLLGVDPQRVTIEDELCCGSFLDQSDSELSSANAKRVFKRVIGNASRVLILTLCGSCTATLRSHKDHIMAGSKPSKICASVSATTIMHYVELLSLTETRALLLPFLFPAGNSTTRESITRVHFQFPCQAETFMKSRKVQMRGLSEILGKIGYAMTTIEHDLGCCGSSLLDTHSDVAIEYGIHWMKNIKKNTKGNIDQVVIACGNCYRLYVDFKPSMDVEDDSTEGVPIHFRFLLDLVMDNLLNHVRADRRA